jgi:hypothetical protein
LWAVRCSFVRNAPRVLALSPFTAATDGDESFTHTSTDPLAPARLESILEGLMAWSIESRSAEIWVTGPSGIASRETSAASAVVPIVSARRVANPATSRLGPMVGFNDVDLSIRVSPCEASMWVPLNRRLAAVWLRGRETCPRVGGNYKSLYRGVHLCFG